MAKIICITSGLSGILNASFELMSRLREAGHDVLAASPLAVQAKVSAQGFDFITLPPINYHAAPPLPEIRPPLKKIKRWINKIQNSKERREYAVAHLGLNEFRAKIDRAEADLVIVDIELHEYIMQLQASQGNLLLLSQWFSIWNRPGLPPITSSTIPGQGFLGTDLGIRLQWQFIKFRRWQIFLKKKITSGYSDRRTVLQYLARKTGFPRRYIRENYWPGPFVYADLPVISMTAYELEFPHKVRPNHTYVGPMVFDNRIETQVSSKDRERIESFLHESRCNNFKLIYCSLSTFKKGDTEFTQKVISAVSNQPEWRLVVGLGGQMKPKHFPAHSKNILLLEWAPQLFILSQAHCSINHGGVHSINECIHFNVPMLVYSGNKSDQNGCAARVQYHGIGLMGDKDKDSEFEIQRKLKRIFQDPSFQHRMNQLSQRCRRYKSDHLIEGLVANACGEVRIKATRVEPTDQLISKN